MKLCARRLLHTFLLVTGFFTSRAGGHKIDCHFGGSRSTATVEATKHLFCVSPKASRPGSVLLHLSFDDFIHRSNLRFSYFPVQSITSVLPLVGPTRGGTVLTLTSTGLSQALQYCRFGGHGKVVAVVPAQWQSVQRVVCVAPRTIHRPGKIVVEASSNGQQWTESGWLFSYVTDVALVELQPAEGPVLGGTTLTIRSRVVNAFHTNLKAASCQFNASSRVPAFMVDLSGSTAFRCVAPASPNVGAVVVRISYNGQDMSTDLYFDYVKAHVLSASPPFGPLLGGSIIRVAGTLGASQIQCCFGDEGEQMHVSTTEPSNAVSCISPARRSAGRVGLSLLCDRIPCGRALIFEYVNNNDIELVGISPDSGAQDGTHSHDAQAHEIGLTISFVRLALRTQWWGDSDLTNRPSSKLWSPVLSIWYQLACCCRTDRVDKACMCKPICHARWRDKDNDQSRWSTL